MEKRTICPKCTCETSSEELKKYHYRCRKCWNKYCKEHRYYNAESRNRAVEKYKEAHPITERYCKSCKKMQPIENFAPRKKHCNNCQRTVAEAKRAYYLRISSERRNVKEIRYIAAQAVKLNDSYNWDDVTDKRPFNFY